jgi:hypothetical protein
MASSLFFASSAADLLQPTLPSDCKGAKPVSTYVHTKLSNNPAFDIIRPAKGNSLDVVQLSKSSVLIISDDEADVSCVLLLEKIVRQLTGDVRVVAPEGKSRRRIQFLVRVREPDKVGISRPRARRPPALLESTRSWISARPCPRGIA